MLCHCFLPTDICCFRVLATPVTNHSFEDCRLMMEAKKLGMPMEAGLVEYYKLSPMIGYVS